MFGKGVLTIVVSFLVLAFAYSAWADPQAARAPLAKKVAVWPSKEIQPLLKNCDSPKTKITFGTNTVCFPDDLKSPLEMPGYLKEQTAKARKKLNSKNGDMTSLAVLYQAGVLKNENTCKKSLLERAFTYARKMAPPFDQMNRIIFTKTVSSPTLLDNVVTSNQKADSVAKETVLLLPSSKYKIPGNCNSIGAREVYLASVMGDVLGAWTKVKSLLLYNEKNQNETIGLARIIENPNKVFKILDTSTNGCPNLVVYAKNGGNFGKTNRVARAPQRRVYAPVAAHNKSKSLIPPQAAFMHPGKLKAYMQNRNVKITHNVVKIDGRPVDPKVLSCWGTMPMMGQNNSQETFQRAQAAHAKCQNKQIALAKELGRDSKELEAVAMAHQMEKINHLQSFRKEKNVGRDTLVAYDNSNQPRRVKMPSDCKVNKFAPTSFSCKNQSSSRTVLKRLRKLSPQNSTMFTTFTTWGGGGYGGMMGSQNGSPGSSNDAGSGMGMGIAF